MRPIRRACAPACSGVPEMVLHITTRGESILLQSIVVDDFGNDVLLSDVCGGQNPAWCTLFRSVDDFIESGEVH